MFGLFKKNKKTNFEIETLLMKNIFNSLGDEFKYITNQLNENIITGVRMDNTLFVNHRKFSFKREILNKYEDKSGKFFSINGIKVYDNELNEFVELEIAIGYGILQGYSTPIVKNFNPDISRIDTGKYTVKTFGEDSELIKELFTKEELKIIVANDIYEVFLHGKSYFHIKDLEDGDFIGIDKEKSVFKITHDPFEITQLDKTLIEVLNSLK